MRSFYVVAAVALGLAVFGGAASAADRKVEIKNETSHSMTEFYASNTGENDWEEDILGKGELAAGESIEVDVDDGSGKCKFDFMGVFDDGDKVVKNGVNVCKTGTFTFSD